MKQKYAIKTKYGEFQADISLDKKKVYFVTIPAFPGPMTEARTLVEAKRFAAELIELECLEALHQGKVVVDDTRRVYGKSVRSGAVSLA